MDEDVEDIILQPLTDRVNLLEKDVESYLDVVYDIDSKVNDNYGETKNIRYADLPVLKLAMSMIFLLGAANTVILMLIVFHVGS